VTEIQQATQLLSPAGTSAAGVIFAIALFGRPGFHYHGTMYGQIVMEGFNFRMSACLPADYPIDRDAPAAITVYFAGSKGA
jgi:Mn2+/Fe2+ NRAMP family transporter